MKTIMLLMAILFFQDWPVGNLMTDGNVLLVVVENPTKGEPQKVKAVVRDGILLGYGYQLNGEWLAFSFNGDEFVPDDQLKGVCLKCHTTKT